MPLLKTLQNLKVVSQYIHFDHVVDRQQRGHVVVVLQYHPETWKNYPPLHKVKKKYLSNEDGLVSALPSNHENDTPIDQEPHPTM